MHAAMIIRAPAKINLGLTVHQRRPDGFHEISTVMQQLSLSDTILLEPRREQGYSFFCSDPVLSGNDNLVCRAAALLSKKAGPLLPGVKISLYKGIPVAAGLGGGSSDAAAVLKGLNDFWRLGLSTAVLMDLGSQIGSDIPYCLQGGTALARGRGEKITPLPGLPFYWVVLALPPGLSISTGQVYSALDPAQYRHPPLAPLLRALRERQDALLFDWFSRGMTNTLEKAILPLYPRLEGFKSRFSSLGLFPAMSGSGPAFFALTGNLPAARGAVRALQETGNRAFLCWTVSPEQQTKE
ncbi:MAG: 4-(cytidine 5'-diphospho)-2-C-methyl-D-erythritol kinase [Firmicutes bacterium]|jgi:4-diphosphocytidyl-2-C-methyl-D-erythritol kinase|nr:4-(cytidine 5'-diphospho)-2-C-methyl-D-erythritol kinase [Bacillota bacterium]